MMRRRLLTMLSSLLLTGALSACSAGGADDRTRLAVFAAASLQQPFEQIGHVFEREHKGVDVVFSFAGSATLVDQIRQGAAADVLATADTRTMDQLVETGSQVSAPVVFASNRMMIAVPAGNPAGITDLYSLESPEVSLVICAPVMPCGDAAQALAHQEGVSLSPVSEEQSVTDVLNKVTSGQADAGLVYASDVQRAGDAAEGIPVPPAAGSKNLYPVASLTRSERPQLAAEFIELVRGETGQRILAEHGFGAV